MVDGISFEKRSSEHAKQVREAHNRPQDCHVRIISMTRMRENKAVIAMVSNKSERAYQDQSYLLDDSNSL